MNKSASRDRSHNDNPCVYTPDSQFFRRCATVIGEYFWQFQFSASLQAFRRRSGHLTLVGLTTPPVAHLRPCPLDSQGQPPKTKTGEPFARGALARIPLQFRFFFNRQPGRLETPVTHTKQTAATTFNRRLSRPSRLPFLSAQGLCRSHATPDFQFSTVNFQLPPCSNFVFPISRFC
jgi:hypothetical protein